MKNKISEFEPDKYTHWPVTSKTWHGLLMFCVVLYLDTRVVCCRENFIKYLLLGSRKKFSLTFAIHSSWEQSSVRQTTFFTESRISTDIVQVLDRVELGMFTKSWTRSGSVTSSRYTICRGHVRWNDAKNKHITEKTHFERCLKHALLKNFEKYLQ